MSDIPLDALVAKALERRKVHAVGAPVYVRNSVNGAIEVNEVLGVVIVTSNALPFHLHYIVAAPCGMPAALPPRVIARRVVAAQYVFEHPEECVPQATPPREDSVDEDVYAAVHTHRRRYVAEQQQRHAKRG